MSFSQNIQNKIFNFSRSTLYVFFSLVFLKNITSTISWETGINIINLQLTFIHAAIFFLVIKFIHKFNDISVGFKSISKKTWLLLLTLIMLYLIILKPLIPHNIWHGNNNGLIKVVLYRDNARSGHLGHLHGYTFNALTRSLKNITFGKISLFSANYLISTLSIILLFFLTYTIFKNEEIALLASFLLAILPAHLRLSASESSFISLELFLIMTLLFFLLFIKENSNTSGEKLSLPSKSAKSRSKTKAIQKKDSFSASIGLDEKLYFTLGLSSLFLLLQTRASISFLAPLIMILFFCIFSTKNIFSYLKYNWVKKRLLLFILLLLPRIMNILSNSDPRQKNAFGALLNSLSELKYVLLKQNLFDRFFLFFNHHYTPMIFIFLFLVGTLFLCKKQKYKEAAFLIISNLIFSVFYTDYIGSINDYIRCNIPNQFLLIIITAFGLYHLKDLLPNKYWKNTGYFLLIFLIIINTAKYHDLIFKLDTSQQEFTLFQRTYAKVPDNSIIVYLSDQDIEEPLTNDSHKALYYVYRSYFKKFMGTQDQNRKTIGIKDFLKNKDILKDKYKNIYYLKGKSCYMEPISRENLFLKNHNEKYLDPFCFELEKKYKLEAVEEIFLSNKKTMLAFEHVKGSRKIGLYKILSKY
jgi:hypothetical protein